MKKIIGFLIMACLSMTLSTLCDAKVLKADIIRTWTGLQQEGKLFNHFTLVIEAVTDSSPKATGSLPLVGLLTVLPAKVGTKRAPAPQTVPVKGGLFPEMNLVKLQYTLRHAEYSVYGVLNRDKSRLALVYGGRSGSHVLPIYLTVGPELPDVLSPFATSRKEAEQYHREVEQNVAQLEAMKSRIQVIRSQIHEAKNQLRKARRANDQKTTDEFKEKISELNQIYAREKKVQQDKMKQQARKMRELQLVRERMEDPVLAEIDQKMLNLQRQIDQAEKNKDIEKKRQLSKEVRALKQERAAVIKTRKLRQSARSGSGTCSEKLMAWASELEKNGASESNFSSILQLANLFRPSIFEKYFNKTLLSMDPDQRRSMGYDLNYSCTKLDNAFSRGRNILTVAEAFADEGHQINYLSAAIAGETLDTVHQWLDRTLMELIASNALGAMEILKVQSVFLLDALWPDETKAAKIQIAAASSKIAGKSLYAQIDTLAAKGEDYASLTALGRLPKQKNWKKLTPLARQEVRQYLNEKADPGISRYIKKTFPKNANNMKKPRQALITGKKWYEENSALFFLFMETDEVIQFNRQFLARREKLFQKISRDLKKELATIKNAPEARTFANELSLPLDNQGSSTWQDISVLKTKQIAALEHKSFVDRVGSGPFKPDHPGAVYLNALYRNDWKTIAEEDRTFTLPLIQMLQPMHKSGMYDFLTLFSQGALKGKDLKQYMEKKMENATMCNHMAGFFVIALEHISPKCLGPNIVEIERTETWDQIFQNGYGMELYRISHSRTYHYTIAQRHYPVFKKIGEPSSAEGIDLINEVFGQFGMQKAGLRESMDTISANLRGLRMAMQKYPCDGEVMKRIEAALIKKATENLF